ncbi:MAG: nucleotidyltransferase domain-containing protein [Candidatus Hydrogenedentota bacterium]
MDTTEAIDSARRFAHLVTERLDVEEVFLFGSCATGWATEDSDIDLAVIVHEIEGDILEAKTQLFRWRHEIDVRLEPLLMESTRDPSGFLEHIRASGIELYPEDKAGASVGSGGSR